MEGSEGLDKIINLEKMKNNISNIIGVVRFNNWIGDNVFEINQKIYCDFPSFNKEKKRYLIAGLEFRSSDFTTDLTLINLMNVLEILHRKIKNIAEIRNFCRK